MAARTQQTLGPLGWGCPFSPERGYRWRMPDFSLRPTNEDFLLVPRPYSRLLPQNNVFSILASLSSVHTGHLTPPLRVQESICLWLWIRQYPFPHPGCQLKSSSHTSPPPPQVHCHGHHNRSLYLSPVSPSSFFCRGLNPAQDQLNRKGILDPGRGGLNSVIPVRPGGTGRR